jgi:hypothetical protein
MIGRLIGIALVIALIAGAYALARGIGPMKYFMDDNALMSQYMAESQSVASDAQAGDANVKVAKHQSALLQSQD